MDKTATKGTMNGSVTPPSSKSYAQRAIAASLLAEGESVISGVELCDDTEAALRVIQVLGATVSHPEPGTYLIRGGLHPVSNKLDIGESGLSTRLFTPIAALWNRPVTVTGHGSILTRPIDMMEAPLRDLGVEIKTRKGRLPLTVCGPIHGGETQVDGTISSQFLTGLLMALPLAQSDTTLYVDGLRSIPYIDMTLHTLEDFGISVEHREYAEFYIPGSQRYRPIRYEIEGDWSGASCMLAAGAIAGSVTLNNLRSVSLQADVAMIQALSRAGAEIVTTPDSVTVSHRALEAFQFDATNCPDLFPALAALAANCNGTSELKGTSRLLHKESNRAETIAEEYGKLGIKVDLSEPDLMRITGGPIHGAHVWSHHDHRIAMSLAVAALTADEAVTITDAECVAKSYRDFWDDFEAIHNPA